MYPTIVAALIYAQRSMIDNYDLGVVSFLIPSLPHITPPEKDIPSVSPQAEDSATVVETTNGNEHQNQL